MSPLFYVGNVIIFFLCTAAFVFSDDAGYRMSLAAPAIVVAGLVCYGAMALLFRKGGKKAPDATGIFIEAAAYRRRRTMRRRNYMDE